MSKKNKRKHVIEYYWRGDSEDTKTYAFTTKEDAWAFVLGEIRKMQRILSKEEGTELATIDFDDVKSKLFNEGTVVTDYCRGCWDNWFYYER